MHKLNGQNYLTVSEAAEVLGINTSTLRHYASVGKIMSVRHPINEKYRLFKLSDLLTLQNKVRDALQEQIDERVKGYGHD